MPFQIPFCVGGIDWHPFDFIREQGPSNKAGSGRKGGLKKQEKGVKAHQTTTEEKKKSTANLISSDSACSDTKYKTEQKQIF